MDAAVIASSFVDEMTFRQAVTRLREIQPVDFGDAVHRLNTFQYSLNVIQILKEFSPNDLLGIRTRGLDLMDNEVTENLAMDALNAINDVAPLDWETMESDVLNWECTRLLPEPKGYPMNWDTWDEMILDPGSYLYPDDAMWAFYSALALGAPEAFYNFNEYFGWGLKYPKKNDRALLCQKMFDLLDQRGLGCFKSAWLVACYDTGSLYYDYNPYEDNKTLPLFNVQGVRALVKEYEKALPIQADMKEAKLLFDDPSVRKTLLRIYTSSLEKDKAKPKSNKLVDIFNPDRENDETDPYGVLEGHAGERTTEEIADMLDDINRRTNAINQEIQGMIDDINPFEYAENPQGGDNDGLDDMS